MATYSFGDVSATLNGPSGSFQLAAGAGAAEEGLSIAAVADTDTMTVGAGGYAMHSLSLDTSATVTVNAQLMNAYTAQRRSSLLHGNNAITVRDVNRGDLVICRQVAFAKVPDLNYGKEGGMNEWVFNAGQTDYVLGVGTPEI
jgi:hypothetical protein